MVEFGKLVRTSVFVNVVVVDGADVAFTLVTIAGGEDVRDHLGHPLVVILDSAEQKLRSAIHNFRVLFGARHGDNSIAMQRNGVSICGMLW